MPTAMDADRIRITPRGWVALLGIPLLLVLLIMQLRQVDERRRAEQFKILHTFLLRPEHAEGLLPLIDRFDPADTFVVTRMGEMLRKMTSEGSILDQAQLIVKWQGKYYDVSVYSSYNRRSALEGRAYLNDPLERALDSLPPGTQLPPDEIYALAAGTGTLRSGVRLNNAILTVTSWRERHDWE